jgi:hypothetical protein
MMGIGGCHWFEGFGNYTEDHRVATFGANSPTITPDSPVALLLKVFYSGHRGHSEPMGTMRI